MTHCIILTMLVLLALVTVEGKKCILAVQASATRTKRAEQPITMNIPEMNCRWTAILEHEVTPLYDGYETLIKNCVTESLIKHCLSPATSDPKNVVLRNILEHSCCVHLRQYSKLANITDNWSSTVTRISSDANSLDSASLSCKERKTLIPSFSYGLELVDSYSCAHRTGVSAEMHLNLVKSVLKKVFARGETTTVGNQSTFSTESSLHQGKVKSQWPKRIPKDFPRNTDDIMLPVIVTAVFYCYMLVLVAIIVIQYKIAGWRSPGKKSQGNKGSGSKRILFPRNQKAAEEIEMKVPQHSASALVAARCAPVQRSTELYEQIIPARQPAAQVEKDSK